MNHTPGDKEEVIKLEVKLQTLGYVDYIKNPISDGLLKMIRYPLNMGELKFSKKHRGRKIGGTSTIPEKLTRRMCVAKVAEIFDIVGKMTPITESMKLDLHELVKRQLDWDDIIPDDLSALWISNFEMMQEINNVRYKRAIIPEDASSLHITTLDLGDSSKIIACVAIYARFQRKNGEYSCHLVLSSSRLIPEGMSQPRAELYAAVLNAHSGGVVRSAFHKYHIGSLKFTDSQTIETVGPK